MTDKAPVTVEQGDDLSERLLWCANADDASAFMTRKAALTRHDLRQASARLQSTAALEEEIKRLREALTPSGSTKAAYHGEFAFNLHRIDDCGDEYVEKVYVPWDTVKQIMKAILARTALEGRGS